MALTLLTPVMTSNTTPSGIVSADTFNISGTPDLSYAYYLFREQSDASPPALWLALGDLFAEYNPPHWAEYDFGTPVVVTDFQTYHGVNYPTDYVLQGWNGSSWIDLYAVVAAGDTSGTWVGLKTVASPAAYNKYRIYVTDFYSPSGEGPAEDRCDLGGVLLWGATADFDVPPVNLAFTPNAPAYFKGAFFTLPSVDQTFAPNVPILEIGPISLTVPIVAMEFTPNAPAIILEPDPSIPSSIIYRCTLTGSPDLVLPISSMQARYRDGTDSYLSVVIPAGETYADDISDRADGEIVLERGVKFHDGTQQLVEIIRVDLEDIRDDQGGSKRSLTISGHAVFTNTVPKSITLSNATYRFAGTGKKRFRADLDLNLRPGDTAIIGVESIVVDNITYTVNTRSEIMEITER